MSTRRRTIARDGRSARSPVSVSARSSGVVALVVPVAVLCLVVYACHEVVPLDWPGLLPWRPLLALLAGLLAVAETVRQGNDRGRPADGRDASACSVAD